MEMNGPTNGMKARRPLRILRSSAKGIPIKNNATVKSRPIMVIEVSCPRNHLWTDLYILPRISLTLCLCSAGKRETNPCSLCVPSR
jgi:hypothetical protein